MRVAKRLPAATVLVLVLCLGGCASSPAVSAPPPAQAPAQAAAELRPVSWDPAVRADFDANVPRFVKALAAQAMEDMAREKGTYLVDRALYDEAMAKYGRKP